MKKNQGFVLFAVLFFIQIYSLLGMQALEQLFWDQKKISEEKQRRILLNEAEAFLTQWHSNASQEELSCQKPWASRAWRELPLQWWDREACQYQGKGFRLYYLVEVGERDPCAEQGTVVYQRVTVLVVTEVANSQKVILQETVLVPSLNKEHCDTTQHSVHLGPQSWCEF